MKKILLVVTMVICTSVALANNDEVDPAVKNAFRTKFPTAVGVEWSAGLNYYKASFFNQGVAQFAFYNEDARLIGVMKYVGVNQLPQMLQNQIKGYYSHYWLTDLFQMSDENGSHYYATLRNADNKMFLESRREADWTLISINEAQ
jgi:hypothetical protein